MQEFRSNGKILLTGEYAVLDGAKSLALPTTKGQTLKVDGGEQNLLTWKSYDEKNKVWFETRFKINEGDFELEISTQDPDSGKITTRLQQILKQLFKIHPEKFITGLDISTHLDFNRNWGLGTSSTLINNLAQWIDTDPYQLLAETFGGSGYDIAAAQNDHPITYQLTQKGVSVFTADFNPEFKDELFFVYLNKKQNSREAIAHYRKQDPTQLQELIDKISGITEQIIHSTNLTEFKMLLQAHETLISKTIQLPRIQKQLFPDFNGLVKSLGAWGGDFVLATGKEKEKEFFRQKGYQDILDYNELIK
ncbi:GYDIA family GHMP kinase [Christiangramia aquimixticola]|uniref:GYDIA family GHMP kinase n=1 Tax=Christiangramia aquimixticola TaxID=1697558 RepID=UPI003AA804A2